MAGQTLTAFIKALRAADVPVSTAETLDAVRAVELLGYQRRDRLKSGLATALAKTEDHRRVFERCFDQFFSLDEAPQAPNQDASTAPDSEPADTGASASADAASLALSDTSDLLLAADAAALQAAMAAAASATGAQDIRVITQKGLVGRRMYDAMGGQAVDEDILALEASGDVAAQQQANMLRARRQALREQIRQYVARQFLLFGQAESRQLREDAMRGASLRDLAEFRDVRLVIEKMARRLVNVHSRRQHRRRRGALDARRTLAASMATDAVPQRLHFRDRRKLKTRLLVVCDVSSSVTAAARFLLMFLAAVADVLPTTRSFVFASRFAEVSDYFSGVPSQQAIDDVLDDWAGSGTDYASMLDQLVAQAGNDINQRTTVIILGDARNNDLPPNAEALAWLRDHCRQVLWLNPEARWRWDSGDSIMSVYAPYCRRVESCATLAQLERFVSTLLRSL